MKTYKLLTALLALSCYSSSYAIVDLNGNGVDDVVEAAQLAGITISGGGGLGTTDTDGDGFADSEEGVAGTDHLDSNDYLRVESVDYDHAADQITVTWKSVAGIDYQIAGKISGPSAANVYTSPVLPGSGGVMSHTLSRGHLGLSVALGNPTDRAYLKLYATGVASTTADSDNDGVLDSVEILLDWDPNNPNSVRSAAAGGDYQQLVNLLTGASPNGGFTGSSAPGAISDENAARFLMQASWGGRAADIAAVKSLGYEAWIDTQLTKGYDKVSDYISYLESIRGADTAIYGGVGGGGSKAWVNYTYHFNPATVIPFNINTAWMRSVVHRDNQLRQRTSCALSQILVASYNAGDLRYTYSIADYYDMVQGGAFGKFRDLLKGVANHPAMGRYLSHIGNQKADPVNNVYPDENFAREIMQLFSIGLWELNLDGTQKLDGAGDPIPTYSNADITELSRVFTGQWTSGMAWGTDNWYSTVRAMTMHQSRHDTGAKSLLGGQISLPAGMYGLSEINLAVDQLCNHPTVAPFMSIRLIQQLVKSNPTPSYVERVATKWVQTDGNIGQVVKAILMDPEARDNSYLVDATAGRLKQPMEHNALLVRVFDAGVNLPFSMQSFSGLQYWLAVPTYTRVNKVYGQAIMFAPSVFNFHAPSYSHPGPIRNNNLVSPELQNISSTSIISRPNSTIDALRGLFHDKGGVTTSPVTPVFKAQLSPYLSMAPEALADTFNLMFTAGMTNAPTRAGMVNMKNVGVFLDRTVSYMATASIYCADGAVLR